ncbi:hypothetical protein Taitung37_14770 [Helicobacter pylori]
MEIYLTLKELKSLIMDLESVATKNITTSKKYPMSVAVYLGINKAERLCLFVDLIDKYGEIWASQFWNLENRPAETLPQELETLVLAFLKEADPNKN